MPNRQMDDDAERPLLPDGCWQIPLVLLLAWGAIRLFGDIWLPVGIAAFAVLAVDLVLAARRGGTGSRLSERRWIYLLIAGVGALALAKAFLW